jgi:hypothetical protein
MGFARLLPRKYRRPFENGYGRRFSSPERELTKSRTFHLSVQTVQRFTCGGELGHHLDKAATR